MGRFSGCCKVFLSHDREQGRIKRDDKREQKKNKLNHKLGQQKIKNEHKLEEETLKRATSIISLTREVPVQGFWPRLSNWWYGQPNTVKEEWKEVRFVDPNPGISDRRPSVSGSLPW